MCDDDGITKRIWKELNELIEDVCFHCFPKPTCIIANEFKREVDKRINGIHRTLSEE